MVRVNKDLSEQHGSQSVPKCGDSVRVRASVMATIQRKQRQSFTLRHHSQALKMFSDKALFFPPSPVAVPRVFRSYRELFGAERAREQGFCEDCGLFKALSVVCVCMNSSFQINLPVWHTLCLTGEACHPASPVRILILVRRADLPFTPSKAKPLPLFLTLPLPPLSPPFLLPFPPLFHSFLCLIPSLCLSSPPLSLSY